VFPQLVEGEGEGRIDGVGIADRGASSEQLGTPVLKDLKVPAKRQVLGADVGSGLFQRQRQPAQLLRQRFGGLLICLAGALLQQLCGRLQGEQVDGDRIGDALPRRVAGGEQHMPLASLGHEWFHHGWLLGVVEHQQPPVAVGQEPVEAGNELFGRLLAGQAE
jgi:hypothetical protein